MNMFFGVKKDSTRFTTEAISTKEIKTFAKCLLFYGIIGI